jgi:hypothetical protein
MAKTSTSFKKGEAKGRPKGTPNKLTRTVKETVMAAFQDLQSDPRANIITWAKDNPTEFYKIASKLIPTEISANVEVTKKELPPFMKANESQS